MINNGLFHLFAAAPTPAVCPSLTPGGISSSCLNLPSTTASNSELHNALLLFFGIAGALSVLMIIIGGFMFVTSGGNPQSAARARETILYAVVGLVVSLIAETIVAFVISKV